VPRCAPTPHRSGHANAQRSRNRRERDSLADPGAAVWVGLIVTAGTLIGDNLHRAHALLTGAGLAGPAAAVLALAGRCRRIIAGVSGSPRSLSALRYAADLACACDAALVPVHAWVPPGGELSGRQFISQTPFA
jgi:Universal stress protein family